MPPADVLLIDPRDPDPRLLARAGGVIRDGGLVAFPTETVYGLGANALDDAAIARIYDAKRRDAADPLIVHLASAGDLPRVATDVPPTLLHVANRFWPGPLTIVAGRHHRVPARVSAGRATVAVRVPAHPVARGLIEAAKVPVAAPSANRFMRASATHAAHVVEDLGDAIDLVLDGGPAEIGLESTVVAPDGDGALRILRPGAIPVEAIAGALLEAGLDVPLHVGAPTGPDPSGGDLSPGLLATHYAPRAPLVLVSGPPPDAVASMVEVLVDTVASGQRVGHLAYDEDLAAVAGAGLGGAVTVANAGAASRPRAVAHRLFAALRDLDAAGVSVIVARTLDAVTNVPGGPPVPGGTGLARAIDDRLIRAAGSRIHRALPPANRLRG